MPERPNDRSHIEIKPIEQNENINHVIQITSITLEDDLNMTVSGLNFIKDLRDVLDEYLEHYGSGRARRLLDKWELDNVQNETLSGLKERWRKESSINDLLQGVEDIRDRKE